MSISAEMAVLEISNYKLLNEKMKEIKKEDPMLFYKLSLLCVHAKNVDKNGDAASAIINFLDFVPQQEDLKVQCYHVLYENLHQFLFKNSASEVIDVADEEKALIAFIQACDNYRINFNYTSTLSLHYQCIEEFLTGKVADPDIKEAISDFIKKNSKEEDRENLYSTLMLRVIDFNIGNISKQAFIKLLTSPQISQDNFTSRHVVAAGTNMEPQVIMPPMAAPINKYMSTEKKTTYYSYPEKIVFTSARKEKASSGMQEFHYTKYTDSSKEKGEMKFLNTGTDWVRNCNNIHLIIENENKTFLEWICLFKSELQSKEYTLKADSSIEDLCTSMADMTDNERSIFMLYFVDVMKVFTANRLGLKELTQEQTTFIENAIALVNQHAFGYKMQTALCATLMKNDRAIAENGKKHDVTVHIELEHNEIIIIEKGTFTLEDANKVSYLGKTKLEPDADDIKATNFIRNFSSTDKTLYEHRIEPAVVLMSEDEMIKKQRALISNPNFILERKLILSTLDYFLEELNSNPEQKSKAEINPKKKWLELKLCKMENALRAIDESKSKVFSEQLSFIQQEIEDPKNLKNLDASDEFFSGLYRDSGGAEIDYPSYQSIEERVAKIKTSLESDSISERDLLVARKNILEFERYIFPKKSVALETLICSIETFRRKNFEPKPYFKIEDCKPVPLQEDSVVALDKEKNRLKQGPPVSRQKSLPAVHSGASTSVISRKKDTVSMFSPRRTTIRGDKRDETSSTLPISTPQQKRKSREKEVPPSDLYTFRSFMG